MHIAMLTKETLATCARKVSFIAFENLVNAQTHAMHVYYMEMAIPALSETYFWTFHKHSRADRQLSYHFQIYKVICDLFACSAFLAGDRMK